MMADKKVTMIIVALSAIILLLLLAMAGGAFWWYKTEKDRQVSTLEKRLKNAENNLGKAPAATAKKAPVDPYEGWLTYTNSKLGYTLRYPTDWKAEEHTGFEVDMPANYVTFTDPNGNYSVAVGLRTVGTDTFITGRTGLGVGESLESGSVVILGQTYPKIYHMLDGKAKVIWFGKGTWTVNGYEAYAELGAPGSDYNAVDLKGIPEEAIAEKIVTSLKLK